MPIKTQTGFSLVELMVALLLSSFLIAAALQIFLVVKKIWINQEAITRLQENTQALSFELGQALRNAGVLGCSNLLDIPVLKVHSGVSRDYLGLSAKFPVQMMDFEDVKTHALLSEGVKKRLKPNLPALGVIAGHDFKSLYHKIQNSLTEIAVKGYVSYDAGDLLIISDCSNADILRVGAKSRYMSNHDISIIPLSTSGQSIYLSKNYRKNAQVAKLESSIYFIGDTKRQNSDNQIIWGLYKTDLNGTTMELIEGIESWQLSLAISNIVSEKRSFLINIQAELTSVEPGVASSASGDRLIRQPFKQTWQVRSA